MVQPPSLPSNCGDGTTFEFEETEFDPGLPGFLALFGDEDLIILRVDLETESVVSELHVGDATVNTGDLEVEEVPGADDVIGFIVSGEIERDDQQQAFALTLPFGLGSSTFELDGTRAIVRGDLGSRTSEQMTYLLDAHPEVDTLVLTAIDGSVDDEVNVETARLVRDAGFTTLVPSNGEVYSGGVDLFAAGVERIAEPDATLGVHAWCCGPDGESAHELAQGDSAHDFQIEYFTEMLGPEAGPEFYFYTLQSARFDGIKIMTPAEMEGFGLVTTSGAIGTAAAELLVVVDGDQAFSTIMVDGFADDSVRGEILTLAMQTDASTGAQVVVASSGPICARGVSEGLCL